MISTFLKDCCRLSLLLRPWLKKGFATFADQALIAGSNFIMNVTLARTLGPEAYGGYTIVFIVFLFCVQIQSGLILEPMSVYASQINASERPRYLAGVVWLHLLLCAILSCLLILGSIGLRVTSVPNSIPQALLGLSIALPCVLTFWTVRNKMYVECSPAVAATASVLYSAVLLSGLALSVRIHIISPFSAYCLMALAALAAFICLTRRMHLPLWPFPTAVAEIARKHWHMGRWLTGSQFAQWAQSSSYPLIAGVFLSVREVGELTALWNFALPINHLVQGAGRLILPRLSEYAASHGSAQMRTPVYRLSGLFFVAAFAYWLVMAILGESVMRAVYGTAYLELVRFLPLAMLGMVFETMIAPVDLALRAMMASSDVFAVLSVAAVLAIAGTTGGVALFGIIAVFVTTSVVSIAHSGLSFWFFLKRSQSVPQPLPVIAAEGSVPLPAGSQAAGRMQ